MPIERGDQITLDVNQLTDHLVTAQWQQSMAPRSQNYYCVPIQKGGENGLLFVQENWLDGFRERLSDNSFTVDDTFQYGQEDRYGRVRWLVWHDKEQRVNMSRFQEAVVNSMGDAGVNMLNGLGLTSDMQRLKSLIGQPLRNY